MLNNEEDKEVTIPTKVSLRNVVSVSAGVSHMCAITSKSDITQRMADYLQEGMVRLDS